MSLDCRNRATLVIRGSLFRRVSTASLASLSVHSLRSTCFYHNHSIVEWLFFLFSRLKHHPATLPCLSANKVGQLIYTCKSYFSNTQYKQNRLLFCRNADGFVNKFCIRIDFLVTICSFEGFKRLLLSQCRRFRRQCLRFRRIRPRCG